MSDDAGTTTTTATEETFTRAQVRAMIGAEVKKVRESFSDYEDLKARAAEGDKSKTAIERIEAKLDEQTKRADKAEREALVRDVADELGVSVRMARKFEGKTRDEMLADGRDTLSDMGIEPDKSKRKASTTSTSDTDNGTDDNDDDKNGAQDDKGATGNESSSGSDNDQQQRTSARRRPTENLRSGSPSSTSGGNGNETLNPEQLAAKIARF